MDEFQTLNSNFVGLRSVITIHVPIKYLGHSNYDIMIGGIFFDTFKLRGRHRARHPYKYDNFT